MQLPVLQRLRNVPFQVLFRQQEHRVIIYGKCVDGLFLQLSKVTRQLLKGGKGDASRFALSGQNMTLVKGKAYVLLPGFAGLKGIVQPGRHNILYHFVSLS